MITQRGLITREAMGRRIGITLTKEHITLAAPELHMMLGVICRYSQLGIVKG